MKKTYRTFTEQQGTPFQHDQFQIGRKAFEIGRRHLPQQEIAVLALALSWLGFVDNSLLNEQTVSLACRPARQRLVHLCELIARLKAVGHAHDDGFELLLTQEKLAAAIGLTPVHLNRTFRRWRTDGLIEITGRALTAPDWAALRQVAGFSPAYLHLEGAR